MLLQDNDPTPPVLPNEVGRQLIPHVGGPQASKEGVGESLLHLQAAVIVYLGLVYCLADRQPTPVYCRISTVHSVAMFCHGIRSDINSTLWA